MAGLAAMALAIAGRTGLGLLLALALSMIGVWVAWGLYYFFTDAMSLTTLRVMFLAGAGVGAGLGGSLAWLRIDGNTRPALLLMGLAGLAGGVAGSWAGFSYGANAEVECCARPQVGLFSYAAFGATLAANGATFLLGAAREIFASRR